MGSPTVRCLSLSKAVFAYLTDRPVTESVESSICMAHPLSAA